MNANADENAANCVSQNGTAKHDKDQIVKQIARLVQRVGLDYFSELVK